MAYLFGTGLFCAKDRCLFANCVLWPVRALVLGTQCKHMWQCIVMVSLWLLPTATSQYANVILRTSSSTSCEDMST